MFSHLFAFLLSLLTPNWMHDKTPDERHFYRRLFTAKHRAKCNKARWLWVAVLGLIVAFPYLPFVIVILLFATFLTFSLLDESA